MSRNDPKLPLADGRSGCLDGRMKLGRMSAALRIGLAAGFLASAAIGWGAITFLSDEDNASALRSSAGFIERGSKFDVSVGDHIGTVGRTIGKHHFQLWERPDLQSCLTHAYPWTQAVNVYSDDTWRRGTACVAFDRRTRLVRSIEWAYGPFMVDL
jgi:hypothetical protein